MFKNERGKRTDTGRIHPPYLQIHTYFMDDLSINFHDKVFLHFLKKIGKKWRKTLSWKFTDESSIKYLQIRKWGRWIRPCSTCLKPSFLLISDVPKNLILGNWPITNLSWAFKFMIAFIFPKSALAGRLLCNNRECRNFTEFCSLRKFLLTRRVNVLKGVIIETVKN